MNSARSSLTLMFIVTALYGCGESGEPNDFDVVCGYFRELDKLESSSSMSTGQRNNYIVEKLNKNLSSSPAMVSWEAVSYAVPEDRYELFKTGAEAELKREWDCPPMEKLAPLTGVEL